MNTLSQTLGGFAFVFMVAGLVASFMPRAFGRLSYVVFASLALAAILGGALLTGDVLGWDGALGVGFFALNLMLAIGIWERTR